MRPFRPRNDLIPIAPTKGVARIGNINRVNRLISGFIGILLFVLSICSFIDYGTLGQIDENSKQQKEQFKTDLDQEQVSRNSPPTKDKELINISGKWMAKWFANNFEHNAQIYITQKDNDLSGIMTITFFNQEGLIAVVKEKFTGTISGFEISLKGESFEYVKRAESTRFHLDNFTLRVNPDGKRMDGQNVDSTGEVKLSFIKEEL